MSTLTYAVSDSATMLRRNLLHMLRYPSMTADARRHADRLPAAVRLRLRRHARRRPRRRRPAAAPSTSNYVAPGILLIAVVGAAQGTAISVAMDMTEGIIARFRTMAIARVVGADRPRRSAA